VAVGVSESTRREDGQLVAERRGPRGPHIGARACSLGLSNALYRPMFIAPKVGALEPGKHGMYLRGGGGDDCVEEKIGEIEGFRGRRAVEGLKERLYTVYGATEDELASGGEEEGPLDEAKDIRAGLMNGEDHVDRLLGELCEHIDRLGCVRSVEACIPSRHVYRCQNITSSQ
jgi:hypothetical protein